MVSYGICETNLPQYTIVNHDIVPWDIVVHYGHYAKVVSVRILYTVYPCFDAYLKLTPTLKRRLLKRRQIGRLTPTLY